nr:hypothetical protein [Tanacetum cinerariifolium]
KSLEGGVKFYLFPRFLLVFLDKQVEGITKHKEMYVISSHTKKIYANIRRIGAGFSRKKVTKLTKWRKSRFRGLRRLKRIGSGRRVKYPMEKDGLGAQEDASEQERMIKEIDQNSEISLDDETQGRTNKDEMFGQSQIPTISLSKDKGKAKIIEPKVSLKRKDQIRIDEEYARKLQAKEQEAARLSRAQQDKEANNSWDNIQTMMDADRLLAERLQARE